jgi:glucose-6-phosphate isomerase
MHPLLRGSYSGPPPAALDEVLQTRQRCAALVDRVRDGTWTGYTGKHITDVVNIGIGGSHLGPCFVTEALTHLVGHIRPHFVSNVDPRDLEAVLAKVRPESTLFVVASKTFSTLETLQNAVSARNWLLDSGCSEAELARHFVAVSANIERASAFGIGADNIFPMWDWVGGRYSLWSAIGLPIAIAVGNAAFEELLAGASQMDAHFMEAPASANMPVIMAMLSVWYRNFLGFSSTAVIPYDQYLNRLPEYLQQLVMESNGKSVARDGSMLEEQTVGVIWGTAGTNGQHSFHQMLHQGTDPVPVDFILPMQTHSANKAQHAYLVANCIGQGQALMLGRTREESLAELLARGLSEAEAHRLAPHLEMAGGRPSNTLIMDALTPSTLGALIALYEHRTAVEGFIWGLNSFDQYGVELGKKLGEQVHQAMLSGDTEYMDASTASLVTMYRAAQ